MGVTAEAPGTLTEAVLWKPRGAVYRSWLPTPVPCVQQLGTGRHGYIQESVYCPNFPLHPPMSMRNMPQHMKQASKQTSKYNREAGIARLLRNVQTIKEAYPVQTERAAKVVSA